MLNGINKDHLTGALVGVGVCAVGYYAYKKNQEKVDSFLRNQGINLANDNCKEFASMNLEELMETKETIEDLIAEKEMLINENKSELCVE